MVSAEDDPYLDRSFGNYRVVRRIARGGQSAIYEAELADERVAVKVRYAARERTPEASERLRREAIAISRLDHPNVVRLLESGETADGNPWLAMELLEGESLAELLTRVGTLSEAEILAIMKPVCEALTEAHRKGIVHRDLKPQNIMLLKQGSEWVPKLLDFGIAALMNADSLTSSVTVSGTPMYMAPEQWAGLKYADERSDVYSLGAIVYRALSGKHAFNADTALAWMSKVRSETPIDLADAMGRRAITPAFREAVMKALARDPEQRPQTPMEFLRALQPAPGAAAPRPDRRFTIAAMAALVAVAAGLGYYAGRPARRVAVAWSGPSLVFLMDTPSPKGVYDADALARGATNADTLSDLFRDLPITTEKETVPSTWNREADVLRRRPAVIVIHRSAFFHSLNSEFGFGYEPFPDEASKKKWELLYRTAEDKLIAFMGLVATTNPETRFLVYSRGTGSTGKGWPDADYRAEWVAAVVRRFPPLKDRVTTIAIEGGVGKGSFKNPVVVQQMRDGLTAILRQLPN
jgi:tRNA A-37 threonylcarbamoyl transferase component Bud32